MGPSIYDKDQADDDNWYDAVADYNTDDFPLDTFDNQGSLHVQKVEADIITHNTKLIAKELCTFQVQTADRPVYPSIYRDHFLQVTDETITWTFEATTQ